MNTLQDYTPKYWVAHDPRTDDVYIDTADKSRDGCYKKISKLMFGDENLELFLEEGKLKIELIEIKLVKTKKEKT